MDMMVGWAWVAYVGVSFIMLFVFLVSVGGFLLDEDESLFERRDDQELFVYRVAQLLGVFRTILWVMIAAVWPLFLVIICVSYFMGMYSLSCRPFVVRCIRWVFLGFGKYTQVRKPSFICGND